MCVCGVLVYHRQLYGSSSYIRMYNVIIIYMYTLKYVYVGVWVSAHIFLRIHTHTHYTVYYVPHKVYYVPHKVYYVPHTVYYAPIKCTMYPIKCTMYPIKCTMYPISIDNDKNILYSRVKYIATTSLQLDLPTGCTMVVRTHTHPHTEQCI